MAPGRAVARYVDCGGAAVQTAARGGLRRHDAHMTSLSGLKILFTAHAFHPNLWCATKLLVEAGAEVHFFVPGHSPHENFSHVQPVFFDAAATRADILARFEALSPDVAILRWEGNELLATTLSVAAKRRGVVRIEYTLDRLGHVPKRKQARLDVWRNLWRAKPKLRITPVRAPGDGETRRGRDVFLPLPVHRAPGPTPEPTSAGRPLRAVLVGKLTQSLKGHVKIIDYLDSLQGENLIDLTIVGSDATNVGGGSADYYRSLQEAAARPRKIGSVTLLKNIAHDAMPDIYRGQDILLLPSRFERLGYSPLEGIAYGVAPIMTAVCGAAGYVEDGVNGVLLTDAARSELHRRITPLLGNAAYVDYLRRGAAETYDRYLAPDLFLPAFTRILDEAAGP